MTACVKIVFHLVLRNEIPQSKYMALDRWCVDKGVTLKTFGTDKWATLMVKSARIAVALSLPAAVLFWGISKNPEGSAFAKDTPDHDAANKRTIDWPVYGGQTANDHYSPLTQINRRNVAGKAVRGVDARYA